MQVFLIYLLKASSLLLVFYSVYKLFLAKETFFKVNRIFLITGIIICFTLPLTSITITKYKKVPIQQNTTTTIIGEASNTILPVPVSQYDKSISYLSIWNIAMAIYILGVLFFLVRFFIKLFSVYRVLHQYPKRKLKNIKLVTPNNQHVAPFSFFNYIVCNNNNLILKHEFEHVKQWHTLDILLTELTAIVLWFFPITYWYNNALKQNLEYLADSVVQRKKLNLKNYQYLLLNTVNGGTELPAVNYFYHSSIKKRILMLQQQKSKSKNVWKTGLIFPLLAIFFISFNIKTVAQTKWELEDTKVTHASTELLIVNTTTEETLQKEIAFFKEKYHIDVTFEITARNTDGLITGINSKFKHKDGNGNYSLSDDKPIEPFIFYIKQNNEGTISCGYQKAPQNQQPAATISGKGSISYSTDNISNRSSILFSWKTKSEDIITITHADSIIFSQGGGISIFKGHVLLALNNSTITNNKSVMVFKDKAGKIISTTEPSQMNIKQTTPTTHKPLIVVNGKIKPEDYNYSDINGFDLDSITILQEGFANEKYGEQGKYGVIELSTK